MDDRDSAIQASTRLDGDMGKDESGAAIFVWGVWLVATALAFSYVAMFGRNIPWWDDWEIVDIVSGYTPLSAKLLWLPHNEHLIPLPNLIHVALARLSHCNYRVDMFFDVACLSALAAGMILTARKVRSGTSYSDSFFPLILLSLGNWNNFLWSFQVQFVSSTVLAGIFLISMVLWTTSQSWKSALAAAICLVALPCCGANGLAYVPCLALWLGYVIIQTWLGKGVAGKATGLTIALLTVLSLVLIGIYFKGFRQVHPACSSLKRVLATAAQFTAMGWGPAILRYSPMVRKGSFGFYLATLVLLLACWRAKASKRPAVLGLTMFLGATCCLALGIGWGRAGLPYSHPGLAVRYVTLAAPALCGIYFAWGLLGEKPLGTMAQMLLFMAALVFWMPNTEDALACGKAQREAQRCFQQDVKSGLTASQLADRYATRVYNANKEMLASRINMLHQAHVGIFRHVLDEPANSHQASLVVPPHNGG